MNEKFLELGPEPNHHTKKRERFSDDWYTIGKSTKNTSLNSVWDLEETPWPLPDGQFRIVFASHVLEHLSDPLEALKECRRVLKEGGICRITVPDANWAIKAYLERRKLGPKGRAFDIDALTESLRSYSPMLHKSGFDKPKLKRLFKEAGFSEIAIRRPLISANRRMTDPYFSSRPDKTIYIEGIKGP